jgi:hypothetical protein
LGHRCGIATYSHRFADALQHNGHQVKLFVDKLRFFNPDIIAPQYEPGMLHPQMLIKLSQQYSDVMVPTIHHSNHIEHFSVLVDGMVLHDKSQIQPPNQLYPQGQPEPYEYTIIPHPAMVYPKKDKTQLREKYKLPADKKILGTMGFIAGTGKNLPMTVNEIYHRLDKKNEFLYLNTSFHRIGDMGRLKQIEQVVGGFTKNDYISFNKGLFNGNREYIHWFDGGRIDVSFVPDYEMNEKMQLCDLLYAYNMTSPQTYGSTSGIAMDMLGSGVKTIVKNTPHFKTATDIGAVSARRQPDLFADDVINLLRNDDELKNIPDVSKYSWDNLVNEFVTYYESLV